MKKVLVIVGPTAVGKSTLGVELAHIFNGEIISGDSMQVYRGLDIGTAKITKEEQRGIPHYLLDIKNVDEAYSVSDFQHDARKLIDEITSKGKLPIIVGGTGLYHKAAIYDYDFSSSPSNDRSILDKYKDYSNEELYEELSKIDQESAKILHPNNRRRVLRAIEIYYTSGKTKSEIIATQEHKPLYDTLFIGLDMDRDELYTRINQRVELQIKQGLLDEVKRIHELNNDKITAVQSIGYKEIIPYLEGKVTLDEAVEELKKVTRRYAKRQYTWFKHQLDVRWVKSNPENFYKTINEAIKIVKEYFKIWVMIKDLLEMNYYLVRM